MNATPGISQELTLTRTAFEARLELDNEEDVPLTNVSITFDITQPGNLTASYVDRFSIGEPTLTALTGVNGSGSMLAAHTTGVASWMLMSYSSAAPINARIRNRWCDVDTSVVSRDHHCSSRCLD